MTEVLGFPDAPAGRPPRRWGVEAGRRSAWLAPLLGGLAALAGAALFIRLFWPGTATHDGLAVYDQAHAWSFGDWQPPLAGVLWTALERVLGPGPQAIMAPTIAVYWLGLFLVFLALQRHAPGRAWLALLVGVLPPTAALVGIVWRDVIFSVLWLAAFALVLVTAGRSWPWRAAGLAPALAAFLVGFWLRPNALFCAVPLLAFLIWPDDWRWRRVLILAVPALAALQLSASAVNVGWLHAKEQHALHSVFVFDLTGITHFSGQNAFPVAEWTPGQVQEIATGCYNPAYWDAIWWPRCSFAMERLDHEGPDGKLFGSPQLMRAWLRAILDHPVAYLEHRLLHTWALLAWRNLVMFEPADGRQWRFFPLRDRAYWSVAGLVDALHDWTPLFRGGVWLALSIAVGLGGLRLGSGQARAAVLALAGSGTVYTLTYAVVGVAAEYRYTYWTTLSSLVGAVVLLCRWQADRCNPGRRAGDRPETHPS